MSSDVVVRCTQRTDFGAIIDLCKRVYPDSTPWSAELLGSHLDLFPEGQLVAIEPGTGAVVGMAASLIIRWDDYDLRASWREFTDRGRFTNHDPTNGRTLYGAEIMVDPEAQGSGVGTALYAARRVLAETLGLTRIRAGARLRGYGEYADALTPEEYVINVINGELFCPTLSFQLRRDFYVIAVVSGYLREDPDSRGYAAVIEWLNTQVASPEACAVQPSRFRSPH